MPAVSASQDKAVHAESSWLLAATFAGLGTGFIALWLTLSPIYSGVLCAFGLLFVWPFARGFGGSTFAMRATLIYFVSAVIGIAVGVASTFGTGMPVSGF